MTVGELIEKHKAAGLDYWYCPHCGYIVSIVEYVSAVCDLPCRCGASLSDYYPRMKKKKEAE
jgi:hypothetical protein